jgi:hypothetical protein
MSENKIKRLDSWKEIAAYLQRDERTALRWAKSGLPVYKSPGGIRGRVFAFAHEIDAWLAEHSTQIQNGQESAKDVQVSAAGIDHKPAVQLWRRTWAWVCLLVVTATTFAAIWAWSSRREAASYKVNGRILQVLDRNDRELWRHNFDYSLNEQHYPERANTLPAREVAMFVDLDGDGQREFLFTAFPDTSRGFTTSSLLCFDFKGNVLWSYRPERIVQYADADFAPPYLVNFFHLSNAGKKGGPIMWVVSQHVPWFPTVVAKLSPDGKVLGEYWHAGHVSVLEETELAGEHVLLVGATNNESFSASLSVLSFVEPSGSSPANTEKYRCNSCPNGQPVQYILFPRSTLSHVLDTRPEVRQVFVRNGGQLEVTIYSGTTPSGLPFGESYAFDVNLKLRSAEITENYASAYAEFRERGLIRRPLDRKEESNSLKAIRYLGATSIAANHAQKQSLKK